MSYFEESKKKFHIKKEVFVMSFLVSLFLGLNAMNVNIEQHKRCISPEDIYRNNQERVFLVVTSGEKGIGTGTGMFTSDDQAITSTHVIDNSQLIFSKVNEQRLTFSLREIGKENSTTKIYSDKTLHFKNEVKYSNKYNIGESVYTIGYPGGLKKLFAAGHISAIDKDYIFVDMPFYPGMSGSPVYDCEGSVIGYVYAFVNGANTIGIVNKNEN